ncbi:very short patch repair endonuclease [Bradyrhizobium sp. dw_78]|uniref:very short patch repair endonuclease n=1 Tax=Bradyrhizobium sp. dw_78 TaxID=2719793 RepID=UPI001BD2FF0D|nr:very short patch repair endonuclease [Bradyrhizobium sp. dw_78]
MTMDRSEIMRAVRSRDTGPELALRRLVHSLGYRYRLHGKGLPGRPDLVFRSRRSVIFVHGCFWHSHGGCPAARAPKSRREYWGKKLLNNQVRDARVEDELKQLGWKVLTVWECQLKDLEHVALTVRSFLT